MRRRETGVVSNFFRQRCYGFVTREGKESSFSTDVQLHIENAKGDKLKDYVRKQGLLPGQQIRYTLDFEEHKGKGYAANWELVNGPSLSPSRSPRGRGSPSYGRDRSPPRRARRSPCARSSPSYGRSRPDGERGRHRGRSESSSPSRRRKRSRRRRSRS
uniref:CSD domain-containing protein n=1 Tax=Noctiluca scintillans TaxID=2966 RepID=A0A7S1ACF2_NOCSC|mmetsp:Transcript_40598/g.107587  ORF Transcript_40598/g.107587 Transcript_40598/m.107587 type:complete len:159 (+) Transcript_40598:195-671(+)